MVMEAKFDCLGSVSVKTRRARLLQQVSVQLFSFSTSFRTVFLPSPRRRPALSCRRPAASARALSRSMPFSFCSAWRADCTASALAFLALLIVVFPASSSESSSRDAVWVMESEPVRCLLRLCLVLLVIKSVSRRSSVIKCLVGEPTLHSHLSPACRLDDHFPRCFPPLVCFLQLHVSAALLHHRALCFASYPSAYLWKGRRLPALTSSHGLSLPSRRICSSTLFVGPWDVVEGTASISVCFVRPCQRLLESGCHDIAPWRGVQGKDNAKDPKSTHPELKVDTSETHPLLSHAGEVVGVGRDSLRQPQLPENASGHDTAGATRQVKEKSKHV